MVVGGDVVDGGWWLVIGVGGDGGCWLVVMVVMVVGDW